MRGLWLFAVGVFLLSWMVPPSILKVQAQKNASEPTSQSEEPLMDLQAFIAAARRHFPGVQAAEARIRAAQAQLDESWVAPFFQGQMTFALALAPEMRGSPIFSPDPQVPVSNPWAPIFQFGLEGIIPIWTFGKIEGTRDAARAALEATRFERQRVEEELIERIRRAYFALALALDLEQLVREAEPRLEEARQELERQIDSNSTAVNPHDKHRLLIALSEFRARAAQVRHIGRMARTALRLLAGIERFRVPDCPIARPAVELLPVERYIEHALAHRPELQALRALLRARRASLEIQRAGFLPDIGLSYLFRTSHAPG
ncbi:MAG: TolC family protein, partial [Deltaproteobacteria bacterium]|nr:TolC family protein [Deltaproteobacteria bacterium]